MQIDGFNFELGVFVKCPHPEIIETLALSGLDFAVVDMEHTPLGPRDLYPLVLAAEARGFNLVVRIPRNEDAYFKWCRDLNIKRIQVPQVESAAEARHAVRHTYFAPLGERGLCRFVRAANFSATPKETYLAQANAENALILQIEGKEGLANLPEILSVLPAGASLFIGPYDLSQSLGKPGQIWDDEVISAMEKIISECSQRNVKVGTFTDTPKGIAFWARKGVSYIEYASDLNLLLDSIHRLTMSLPTA